MKVRGREGGLLQGKCSEIIVQRWGRGGRDRRRAFCVEGHGFEGCSFRKLSFYVEKEPVKSEGRKDEQRPGCGGRP